MTDLLSLLHRRPPGDSTLRRLLAPFDRFLADPGTREVVVNRPGQIGVENGEGWTWLDEPELDFDRLEEIAILAGFQTSRDVDGEHPLCRSTLPDGQRVQICRPPATSNGIISLAIRRPAQNARSVDDDDFEELFATANTGPSRRSRHDGELVSLYMAHDWRAFFKLARRARKSFGFTGVTGSGKAQPDDALVLTPTGFRRMGDLVVDDLIVAADGKLAPVSGVFPQGEKEVFKVTFEDGRSAECCADHLWKVWSWCSTYETGKTHNTRKRLSGASWRVLPLSEVKSWFDDGKVKSHRAAVPLVAPYAIEHPPQDLPIEPYALGALLGDGCFGSNRSIRISTADSHIISRVENGMPAYMAVKQATRPYDYRLLMRVQRKTSPAYLSLIALGIAGCRAHEKFIPEAYKNGSVSQRIAVMQGLMDTDGSVGNGTHASFSSSSKRLAEDVQRVAWSLGAIAKIAGRQTHFTGTDGEKKAGRPSWRVSIVHPDVSQFFSLPRKVAECTPKTMRHRLRIKSIESVGRKPVRCIYVDHPSHLYITNDYLVTHNTDMLKRLLNLTPDSTRVVSLESDAEFGAVGTSNRVSLFYGDDHAKIEPEEALRASLRLRPDEIWMQEVTGAEAFTYIRALAAGHPGGGTSWHAEEGCEFDALELMIKQHPAGREIPDVRKYLRTYLDIIVWCARDEDGFSAPRVWFKAAEDAGVTEAGS